MVGSHHGGGWSRPFTEGRIEEIHEYVDQRMSLLLLFAAFITTFLITRGITRMIRAGKGPFRNNVSDGVHIHHAVPGIILLVIGGISSVASSGRRPGAEISAVLIGIGASLVLDEFALILHLQDVYWSKQGQLSVQVVALTASVLGLLLIGVEPFQVAERPGAQHIPFLIAIVVHVLCLLVCVAKGKYTSAVIGAFFLPVAWWGAIRLARPRSKWAKRYSPEKLKRAEARDASFEKRWGNWGLDLEDLVAGTPTDTSRSTSPTAVGAGPSSGSGSSAQ